jgi:hypothetical protein
LRVLAARVLAHWGDNESKDCLKDLLTYHAKQPAGWSATGAMSEAIAPVLDSSDLEWALELYLVRSNPHVRFSMVGLFQNFDHTKLRKALESRVGGLEGANPREIQCLLNRSPR